MAGRDLSATRALIPDHSQLNWDDPGTTTIFEDILDILELPVRSSDLLLDDDVELNANGLTEITTLKFEDSAAQSGPLATNLIYFIDGDAYIGDGDANQIQVTALGGLNTGSTGGIIGDYGDGGSNVSYSSLANLYTFSQGGGLTAHGRFDQVQFQNGAAAVRITVEAPSTLTTSFTRTLASGIPASTSLLSMNTSGEEILTRDPSVDSISTGTMTATGLITGNRLTINGSSTNSISGLIAANDGIIVGNNDHITVQGAGQYKRSTLTSKIGPKSGTFRVGVGSLGNRGTVLNTGAADVLEVPLLVTEGQRLTAVSARVDPSAAGSVTMELWSVNDGTSVSLGSVTSTGASAQTISISGLTTSILSNIAEIYTVDFTFTSTGNAVLTVCWTHDVP